jgi:hypothetical protein
MEKARAGSPVGAGPYKHGLGPRVEDSGLGVIAGYAFSAPYEDVKLRGKR